MQAYRLTRGAVLVALVLYLIIGLVMTRQLPAKSSEEKAAASPPTALDAWELQSDFAKVKQQWKAIEEVLNNEDYYQIRVVDVSGWSCGMQAGHCALVLNQIAMGIEQGLAEPELNSDRKKKPIADMVLRGGTIPRGVGEAPKTVLPIGGGREHWLGILERAKESWARIEARAAELPENKSRAEHPYFGFLNSTEWVRFAGIHTAHHLKIIRDILEASGEKADGFGKELSPEEPVAE